jgi:hypothetical protein
MNKEVVELIKQIGLPSNFGFLLQAAGFRSLEDLEYFDDEQCGLFENFIKENLKNQVDLTLKSNRVKYLGYDCQNFENYETKFLSIA